MMRQADQSDVTVGGISATIEFGRGAAASVASSSHPRARHSPRTRASAPSPGGFTGRRTRARLRGRRRDRVAGPARREQRRARCEPYRRAHGAALPSSGTAQRASSEPPRRGLERSRLPATRRPAQWPPGADGRPILGRAGRMPHRRPNRLGRRPVPSVSATSARPPRKEPTRATAAAFGSRSTVRRLAAAPILR
jgi:hypothetical protein